MDHPDPVAIDALRTGEGRPEDAAHLDACPACQTLLEELQDLSRRLHGEAFPVPEERDRQILWLARKRAALARRSRAFPPRWAIAAAAVLVLSVVSLLQLRGTETAPARLARAPRGADVDGDGRVDIRDAFVIARAVDARAAVPPSWDVNGDGRVDLGDADLVARAAVTIGGARG